jgi:uncharacterized protein
MKMTMPRSQKIRMIIMLWLAVLLDAAPGTPAGMCSDPATLELEANGYHIEAEVAATPESRTLGLMFRSVLQADHGMLFISPDEQAYCMWMKNTLIPLSAAFLDGNGKIANIAEMEAASTKDYCATGPIQYVLEMSWGWFQRRGIGVGAQVNGLEKAPEGR